MLSNCFALHQPKHALIYQIIMADEDAVYLIVSVVGGLHICKRMQSPTVCKGLQLTREDINDDCFAASL